MTTSSKTAAPSLTPLSFPVVLALFVGSGCAALIYEIVWFQVLSLVVGSSAVSMAVLLSTFMGGMCLGSLLLSKYVSAQQHPLRVYALLEAGIGLSGILILLGLPWVGGLYTAIGGGGVSGLIVRSIVCAICLLPPTMMMGATLPAIARWVETTPHGVSWLGFFYGGNIAGAVLGCVVAGFYLLRVHDSVVATFVAAALNFAVAIIGLVLSKRLAYNKPAAEPKGDPIKASPGSWPVFVCIALSGLTALGAQVVWTRLLTLLVGGTVYTFSLILAAFLTGLGIGSTVGSFLARTATNPRQVFGVCQLLLILGLGWAAYSLTEALPYWPINPGLFLKSTYIFQIDLARCLWVVLPCAILWGASFPLALASVVSPGQDPGRLVGTVYAANTVGAIAGALIASLLLIASVGTQTAQRVLITIAAISAVLVLAPVVSKETGRLEFRPASAVWLVIAIGLGGWLAARVIPVPGILVAYGRYAVTWLQSHGEFIYVGEGINSSMAVSRLSNGVLNYHNAGKVQASSEVQDMRLQRMLGHLTTLIPTQTRSVLVIGCGAGVTAGAVSIDPAVEKLTIAEIEPLVPRVVSTYFSEHNFDVVRNPKTVVRLDDARHFLLTTDEKFDAITSDPFDPWVKGAATLYTKEFFEVMKEHLNPGGVVTVFVQLYESSTEAVKSEIATFLEVFPNGIVWGNTEYGRGYDLVLLGQAEPTRIDVDAIDAKLARPEYAPIAQSLNDIGFNSSIELFGTFAGRGPEIKGWLHDAQINRDRNLRLQYLAGLGLNLYQQDAIYREMLAFRLVPDDLFVGSPERVNAIKQAITWSGGGGQ